MFIVTIVYLLNLPEFVPSDTCDIGGPQFSTPFLIYGWVLSFTLLISMMILMTLMLVKIHTMLKTLFQAEDSAANHFKQRSAQKKSNLARLFTILCFGYAISWGPLIVGLILFTLCPPCGVDQDALKLLSAFTPINACVNVVVYAIKNVKFRKVFIALLKCERNKVHSLVTANS